MLDIPNFFTADSVDEFSYIVKRPQTWVLILLVCRVVWSRIVGALCNSDNASKITESSFKALYMAAACVFAHVTTHSEAWRTHPGLCWTEQGRMVGINDYVSIFYAMQIGYYAYSIIAQFLLDEHRKDFFMMVIHHLITFGLVVGSYAQTHMCYGTVVLVCFDISDLFMEIGKTCSDLKLKYPTIVAYFLLLTTWIYWRLYFYPFHVLTSVFDGIDAGLDQNLTRAGIYYKLGLGTLFLLQLFWTKSIIMVGIKSYKEGGTPKDVREISEEKEKHS